MPRVNFAWDIAVQRQHMVLRGGAGIFFNRPKGNAEYDVIHVPPNAYGDQMDAGSRTNNGRAA